MGEEVTMKNGVVAEEKKVDDIPQKKEEVKAGVVETEEDSIVDVQTQKMDVDPVGKENKETEENGKANTVHKQEEAEVRNEASEEKNEEMETDLVGKEDKETKEEGGKESGNKQEEVENEVNEKKEEMETDFVSKKDGETEEEGKEESVSKQEEEEAINEGVEEKNDEKKTEEAEKEPGSEPMEEDTVAKENEESKEEEMTGKETAESKEEEMTAKETVESKEEEMTTKETAESKDEARVEVKKLKKEVGKGEVSTQDVGIKAKGMLKKSKELENDKDRKQDTLKTHRAKGQKSDKKDVEEKEKEKEKEPKTPATLASDRPVRERKSVERLVASIEKDSVRDFQIKKGRGNALKDIPNVAFKLSKRKTGDDTLKLLHTILFGRRAKAVQVKSNISKFSGFVWNENEEKQKIKFKERLDKFSKAKLVEFCDLLDLPIAKADEKEGVIVKFVDFLMAPDATTTELLAEKEQPSKGTKRKRSVKENGSDSVSPPSKCSAKERTKSESASKKGGKVKTPEKDDEESDNTHEQEELEEEEDVNGVPEKPTIKVPKPSESEEENEDMEVDSSEEEEVRRKSRSERPSAKKESVTKTKAKKVATPKKKSAPPTKKNPVKSSLQSPKNDGCSDMSPKTFSRKKQTDNGKEKEKATTPKQPASKEKSGKKVVNEKGKPKEEKLKPSDAELRRTVSKILEEVDFNTATFTDILKLIDGWYKSDLTARKSSIKLMIQDALTKIAEAADDDDDEEKEPKAEKIGTQPSAKKVKA